MFTLKKTLDSSWEIARVSLRQDLDTIQTTINRRWGQTFGTSNVLGIEAGGLGLTSVARGDLLYASAADTLARLAIGSAGKILRSTGTIPNWSTFTIAATFAQGDVLYASTANSVVGLAKDTNATRYLSNTGGSNNPAWALVDVSNGVTGMAALTKTDDTNVTLALGGTPASALIRAVSLTLGWTGTLAVSRGGIGVGTLTANGILYGNGTSAVQAGAALTNGKIPVAGASGILADSTIATLVAGGVPAICDTVALTAQVADIGSTNLANSGTVGTYEVLFTLQDTTADAGAGTVTLTVSWTDGAGAATATLTQTLATTGRVFGTLHIQLASGNIAYATTHTGVYGTAQYAVYIALKRLS